MQNVLLKTNEEERQELVAVADPALLANIPIHDVYEFSRKAVGTRVNRRNVRWDEYRALHLANGGSKEDFPPYASSEMVGEWFTEGYRGATVEGNKMLANLNHRHVALVIDDRKRAMFLDIWRFRGRMLHFLLPGCDLGQDGDNVAVIQDHPVDATLDGGVFFKVTDNYGSNTGVMITEPRPVRVRKVRLVFGLLGYTSARGGIPNRASRSTGYPPETHAILSVIASDSHGKVAGFVGFHYTSGERDKIATFVQSTIVGETDPVMRERFLTPNFDTRPDLAGVRIVRGNQILLIPEVYAVVEQFFRRLPVVGQAWEALKLRHARLLLKYADI